jgi:hypothetical protein
MKWVCTILRLRREIMIFLMCNIVGNNITHFNTILSMILSYFHLILSYDNII